MRFGIMSFCRAPYQELADRFRAAEEMGFDSGWVDDDTLSLQLADFEPWTLLAALSRETTRLRLGTLVTVPTFRHPTYLAAQVTTVDYLSGGRAELGLGAGGPPNNYGAFGHDLWSPRERADRLEEQANILGALLRGELVSFEGQHYRVQDAQLPLPVQRPRPPFLIAAHGERGLRAVARYADGWNSMGGQAYAVARDPSGRVSLAEAVANTKRLSDRLDEICHEIERDPAMVRRSILAYRPATDPLASLDAFDEYVGRYREIGISEIVFYWPPLDNIFPGQPDSSAEHPVFEEARPVSPSQQAAFEKIVAERIAGRLTEGCR
jgi:alkanesulfonate monooxygenase SsuD/methylene tetrahydromethanopterin reductase-like flavin-dependent oxidoreductase (luciferase family)